MFQIEHDDKEKIKRLVERIDFVESVSDAIATETKNDVTKESELRINEEHFRNCLDVLSDINLSEFMKFHKKKKSLLTIATKQFQYKNPYGVIVSRDNKFVSFREKPEINFTINTGIYIFNKKIIPIINKFNLKNIEDLITLLGDKNYKIHTYPIFENWHDLGQDKKKLKKYN
jgi:NDP-sugar pyrophosphorylase family protein